MDLGPAPSPRQLSHLDAEGWALRAADAQRLCRGRDEHEAGASGNWPGIDRLPMTATVRRT